MSREVSVTLHLRIWDPKAFVEAARKRAIEEGATEEETHEMCDEDSLGACAQMLFDPGVGPPGCEILESESD